MKQWKVRFRTPQSKGMILKEIVTADSWQYAKLALESRYPGIVITGYEPY